MLTEVLDKSLYESLATPESELWFEDRRLEVSKEKVMQTSRIEIDSVPSPWRGKPCRFVYDVKKYDHQIHH